MPIYKKKGQKDGKQKYLVCVNYTDRNGEYRQRQRTVYGASEAKIVELQMQKEISDTVPDSAITINQLYEEYIKAKEQEVRATSLAKTKGVLNCHILPHVGNIRLDKLDTATLQKWKLTIGQRDVKITTKKNTYKEFRALLNYAVKMDYISRNPLLKVGDFKEVYFEKPQDKLHYYTPEQFKRFIAVAKDHCDTLTEYGYFIFFNIAFYTGMRKGEINALKWSDIDGNIIHVRRSIAQKLKSGDIETPPKNRTSYRDIQIPSNLAKLLQEHKERHKTEKRFSEDFRVCGGYCVLRDSSIENKNKQYASKAELPHIRIHDFRHSHASLLANEGINIQEIARRLGHAKIEMTWNTYSHLYPREEERAIKILEKI